MNTNQVRSIVILGGGSAGWMTAASLIQAIPKNCHISLIESDEIGTVGVGEATIPPIKQFNKRLGIDENTFLRETKGTFKLGIEFVDWAKKGHSYCHPFGQFGAKFDHAPFYQYWLKSRKNGNNASLDEYSMAWALARSNKFDLPQNDPHCIMSTFDYAYHFDAGLYANFLRKKATREGVNHIKGKVISVDVEHSKSTIKQLILADDRTIKADFFIDCSGFSGILIEKALHAGYTDWGHFLPCDSAVTIPTKKDNDLPPYTRSTAKEAGWQWRIPLQHRTGNGYVYSSKFICDEEAKASLMNSIDGEPLESPKLIRFKTGHRNQMWKGNCLAIGLAAGFLEPLESTALHLVQTAINRFIALFPTEKIDKLSIQEYNELTLKEYETVRDFIILHYHATSRNDSAMWRKVSKMDIPETLSYKIKQFSLKGHIVNCENQLFKQENWLAVLTGQEITPKCYSPIVDMRSHIEYEKFLHGIKDAIDDAAKIAPTHQQYINKFCKASNC